MTRRNDSSSSFRPVVAGSHYVYSAYYDDRETTTTDAGRGVVRVIAVLRAAESAPAAALTPRAPAPALFCHVDMLSSGDWSLASVLMALVWTSRYYSAPLHYYEMCENHGKDYGGWILTCPLPRAVHRPPCRLLVPAATETTHCAVITHCARGPPTAPSVRRAACSCPPRRPSTRRLPSLCRSSRPSPPPDHTQRPSSSYIHATV